MARTRAKKTTEVETVMISDSGSTSKFALEPRREPSSHVFVLPKAATPEARVVTLPNPRHGGPSRYLICPHTGFYEFTRISAPNSASRSWLIETEAEASNAEAQGNKSAELISGSDMFLATTIDPLFLLLPALIAGAATEKDREEKEKLFFSSDDYFDQLCEEQSNLNDILLWGTNRTILESRMEVVCDTVHAGDEKMFRINNQKLLATILAKAKRMSESGLPSSMEEKFVKTALEAPVLLQKKDTVPLQNHQACKTSLDSGPPTPVTDFGISQSTAVTANSSSALASQASSAPTSVDEEDVRQEDALPALEASAEVIGLQRLRVAFDFICARYVPTAAVERLRTLLSQPELSLVDFSLLDKYLAALAELRAEVTAATSTLDYSRKRLLDEEQEELRAEKKKKLEEEKKRKASESRGVRDLKKVNTSGMMKLSHFFRAK